MGFHENVAFCMGCKHRQRPCAGSCICLGDSKGEDIITKAKNHDCPHEWFPSRGLGDTIAKVAHAIGADKAARIYEKVTGKPCGCPERQAALNQAAPYTTPPESANHSGGSPSA